MFKDYINEVKRDHGSYGYSWYKTGLTKVNNNFG